MEDQDSSHHHSFPYQNSVHISSFYHIYNSLWSKFAKNIKSIEYKANPLNHAGTKDSINKWSFKSHLPGDGVTYTALSI